MLLRKLTYASPICGDRAAEMNDLLGLDNGPVLDAINAPSETPIAGTEALTDTAPGGLFGPGSTAAGGGNGDDASTPVTSFSPDFPLSPFPLDPSPVLIPITDSPTGQTDPTAPTAPATTDPSGSTGPTAPITVTTAASVPEPSSWAMMLTGFGLIGAVRRRQQSGRAA